MKTKYIYTIVRFATGYNPHCLSSHSSYDDAVAKCGVYLQEFQDKGLDLEQIKLEIQMNSYYV